MKKILNLISATAFAQIITIIAMPFITRIFSPEDMGSYQTFITAVGIFSLLVSLKYERAIPLPKSEKESYHLLIGVSFITIINSVIVGIFISVLPIESLDSSLFLFIFTVMFMSLFQTFNFWNTRQEMYNVLIKSRVIRSLSTVIIQLVLGYLFIANGLVLNIGYSIGYLFAVLILMLPLFKKNKKTYRIELNLILELFKKYKDFLIYNLPSSLLNATSQSLPVIMLATLFNMQVVGLFSLGQRVLTLPISIFGQSISQIIYQQASNLVSDNKTISPLLSSTVNILFYIIFAPIIILLFFGKEIFILIFGVEWSEAGIIAGILAPWLLMVFLISPLSLIFNIYNKQKSILRFEIALIILRAAALSFGGLQNNYILAIILFSLVSTLAYIFQALWLFKLTSVKFSEIKIVRTFLFIIPAGILYYWSNYINSDLLIILMSIVLLGIYYISILVFDTKVRGMIFNGRK